MARRRRTLHLLLGIPPLGGHRAAWRRAELPPGAQADPFHYAELIRLAETAKLDAVVLPDAAALAEDPASAPPARLDPSVLLAALASATSRIGLVAGTGTSTAHPFEVARRIASLDLVSGGRAALLATSEFPEAAALNMGDDPAALHEERHRRAAEFLHVVHRLWDSWHPSAVVGDAERGLFADPDRIAPIDHHGEFFDVRGPLPVPRGPQGRPPVLVAASSDAERALAARYGEIVLGGEGLLERAVTAYNEVKARAAAIGRSPDRIRVLGRVATVIAATEADARARLRDLDAHLREDGEPLGAAGWAEEGRGGRPAGRRARADRRRARAAFQGGRRGRLRAHPGRLPLGRPRPARARRADPAAARAVPPRLRGQHAARAPRAAAAGAGERRGLSMTTRSAARASARREPSPPLRARKKGPARQARPLRGALRAPQL